MIARFIGVVLFVVVTVVPSHSAGTSGGTMLKYSPGARQQALGDCGSALGGDFNSINFNPALLAVCPGFNASVLYDNAFDDAAIYYGAVGKSFKFINTAMAFTSYQGGNILINDRKEDMDGSILNSQTDYLITLFLAKKLLGGLSLGVAPKYFYSTLIEEYQAAAVTADAGLFLDTAILKMGKKKINRGLYSDGLNLGVSARNIFGEIKYDTAADPLPMEIRGGFSYPLKIGADHSLLILDEILKSNEDETLKYGAGIEYTNKEMFHLRGGYRINYGIRNFSAGIGLNYYGFIFDYSMLFNSAINNNHLVMVSYSSALRDKLKKSRKPGERKMKMPKIKSPGKSGKFRKKKRK